MQENGIRAEDIAVRLQISYSTVQRGLQGKPMHRSTIKAISDLTGIPMSDLESGSVAPATKTATG